MTKVKNYTTSTLQNPLFSEIINTLQESSLVKSCSCNWNLDEPDLKEKEKQGIRRLCQ